VYVYTPQAKIVNDNQLVVVCSRLWRAGVLCGVDGDVSAGRDIYIYVYMRVALYADWLI
jgi:hypothetical protein